MLYDAFKEQYGIRLNAQQERAVRKTEGPALLLAVPGSGKTTVIVARVGYMVFCAGIHPAQILTLTFSKAAASEMKERFCRKFGEDASAGLHFSTIHSFCLSVIRRGERRYGVRVPELEADNTKIIRRVYFKRFYEYPSDIAVRELTQYIGFCKNMMYTEEQIEAINVPQFDFKRFFDEYEDYKRENNLMDFDDQLLLAYRILEEHPELLEAFHAQYRYINVDEAQDTSLIQHKLIQKMAAGSNNLFMVGDEDQSIYGFRAAYPDALMRFEKDHPGAEILLLETNYRCAANIAGAAEKIIRSNQNRHDKSMRTVAERGVIRETKLRDSKLQYRYLCDRLREAARQARQVAVLYRNNESAIPLVDLLDREGIAFDGDVSMAYFGHFVVRDLILTLRLALNARDLDAYGEIYYKLGLYTNKKTFLRIKEAMEQGKPGTVFSLLEQFTEKEEQARKVHEFAGALVRTAGLSPLEALQSIEELFYRAWIRQRETEGAESMHSMEQKMTTLYALAAEQKTIPDFLGRIGALQTMRFPAQADARKTITLSTIHSSKGMEFDKVILMDVCRGILPSERGTGIFGAADANGREEEVRLFYVALTRAKHEIEVVTSNRRFGKHVDPSPFVTKLFGKKEKEEDSRAKKADAKDPAEKSFGKGGAGKPGVSGEDPESFTPGTVIRHKFFGTGKIMNRTGDVLTIRFDEQGEKRMLLSACLQWGYLEKIP